METFARELEFDASRGKWNQHDGLVDRLVKSMGILANDAILLKADQSIFENHNKDKGLSTKL